MRLGRAREKKVREVWLLGGSKRKDAGWREARKGKRREVRIWKARERQRKRR